MNSSSSRHSSNTYPISPPSTGKTIKNVDFIITPTKPLQNHTHVTSSAHPLSNGPVLVPILAPTSTTTTTTGTTTTATTTSVNASIPSTNRASPSPHRPFKRTPSVTFVVGEEIIGDDSGKKFNGFPHEDHDPNDSDDDDDVDHGDEQDENSTIGRNGLDSRMDTDESRISSSSSNSGGNHKTNISSMNRLNGFREEGISQLFKTKGEVQNRNGNSRSFISKSVDGRDFFKRARSKLTYDDVSLSLFTIFLWCFISCFFVIFDFD